AGSFINVVGTAQVARVVVSDFLSFESTTLYLDAPLINELLKEGRMVNYIVLTAEVGIFIFQYVEAVRAGRHDFLYAITIQHLNVVHGLHLEQELVAGPAGGVSRTRFFGTQHCEAYTHRVEYGGEGARHPFISVVVRAGASHPEQYFGCFSFG